MKENRFAGLRLWTPLLFVAAGIAGVMPMLLPLVVAFAVVYLAGVIVIAAQFVVDELRASKETAQKPS